MSTILENLKKLPNHTILGKEWLSHDRADKQYPYYAKIFNIFDCQSIFEVGTYLGYSLACAAMSCPNLKNVCWYDNEEYLKYSNLLAKENIEFARSLTSFDKIEANSLGQIPTQGKYDVVHIDGGHDYLSCYNDILKCINLTNNVIIGHDYDLDNSGVEMAVKAFCKAYRYNHIVLHEFNHGLWMIPKTTYFYQFFMENLSNNCGPVTLYGVPE